MTKKASPLVLLQQAEQSIDARDFAGLSYIAEDLAHLAIKRSYLARPLIAIGHVLAREPAYLSEAVQAWSNAVSLVTGDDRRGAVTDLTRYAEKFPEPWRQIDTLHTALCHAEPGGKEQENIARSYLDKTRRLGDNEKILQAYEQVADDLAKLPALQMEAVNGLLKTAPLVYKTDDDLIRYLGDATDGAQSDGAPERALAAAFAMQVDRLPDSAIRIDIFTAHLSESGNDASSMQRQCIAGLLRHAPQEQDLEVRLNLYDTAAAAARQHPAEEQKAVDGFMTTADRLPAAAQLDAFAYFADYGGSPLLRNAAGLKVERLALHEPPKPLYAERQVIGLFLRKFAP